MMRTMAPFHPSRWPERLPARYWLARARVPSALLERPAGPGTVSLPVSLLVDGGRIAAIEPAPAPAADGTAVFDLDGATVLPAFVDVHTHLDKGDLLATGLAPERDLFAAVARMREVHPRWTEAELRARIGFALRTALAHGTRALNTYVDWPDPANPEGPLAWRVLAALKRQWAGRLELGVTSLLAIDRLADEAGAVTLARTLALGRGALGLFIYPGAPLQWLPRAFDLAERFDLALDFHVDEHLEPAVANIGHVARLARLARERGYGTRVVCGHACVLGVLADEERDALLDEIAASGLTLTCLPYTNLYLQDSGTAPGAGDDAAAADGATRGAAGDVTRGAAGTAAADDSTGVPGSPRRRGATGVHRRTPRRRGLLPLHEARARGIPLAFASDNHRDLFFPGGDLDLLQALALAANAAQLDDAVFGWADTVTTTPARFLGLADAGALRPGASADLVLHPGRTSAEVLGRPHPGRQVIRAGQRLGPDEAVPPDFRELDHLLDRKGDSQPERRSA